MTTLLISLQQIMENLGIVLEAINWVVNWQLTMTEILVSDIHG